MHLVFSISAFFCISRFTSTDLGGGGLDGLSKSQSVQQRRVHKLFLFSHSQELSHHLLQVWPLSPSSCRSTAAPTWHLHQGKGMSLGATVLPWALCPVAIAWPLLPISNSKILQLQNKKKICQQKVPWINMLHVSTGRRKPGEENSPGFVECILC